MESNVNEDPNYGTLYLGNGEIKKAISLPVELRDGGTADLGNIRPWGWSWNGELHLFSDEWLEYWDRDKLL